MRRPLLLRNAITFSFFAAILSVGTFSFVNVAKAAGEPVVTTGDTQGVTDSFAQMGFYINDSGTSDITEYGVNYATDAYYAANGNTYDQVKSAHDAVASTTGGYFYVYSLACGTTYHFSAFATNDSGTGTGEDATFTTNACPLVSPNITLNSPSGGSIITNWTPSVTWESAATCSYSYDDSTFTNVDCGSDGSDIPTPAAGTVNLYLRALSSDDIEAALWATFTYDPPPTLGWNSQPNQASPSDTSIVIDTYVNDAVSNPVSYTVEYSLNGGSVWNNVGHLSGTGLTISGNTISDIATHGDGAENRSQVAFAWNFTEDASAASTTDAEIRVTANDANGTSTPLVSDLFTLRAPPAPPVFADDSGAVTDITENSVIVHYDMSSIGSAQLHHFELHYADDAYYTVHSDYSQNAPVTYTGAFADNGATDVSGLSCGTEYHFVQSFTNGDNQTATSSDATFTTSDCTGGGGGGGGGGGTYTFPAGDGSADNPYIVDSCDDLMGVDDYLDASFLLDTDLDCSANGSDIIVGAAGSGNFSGTFDGGGNSVTIDIESETPGAGLFAFLYGATVKDLSIAEGSIIFGSQAVGSLAGFSVNSTILNVSSAATVVSFGAPTDYPPTGTGGIVGGLYGGTIDGAEFTGIVGAPFGVGGIAGVVMSDLSGGEGGIISRSYANGQVAAGLAGGGIAGYVDYGGQVRNSYYASSSVGYYAEFVSDSLPATGGFGGLVGLLGDGTISRSYAVGSVIGGPDTDFYPSGGLVGFIASSSAVIVHSFAASQVSGAGAPLGGFVGGIDESESAFTGLYDDYFDTERTGQTLCASTDLAPRPGCDGVDGSETGYWLGTDGTPLSAWDRTSVWDVSGGDVEFPVLRAVSGSIPDESDAFVGGGDSEEDSGGGDSGGDDASQPSASRSRGGPSRASLFSRIDSYISNGDQGKLEGYVKNHANQLVRYYGEGRTVPQEAVALLGLAPAAAYSVAAPAPSYPVRNLELGADGADVLALQKLLNANGFTIAESGAGSPGNETTHFGTLTKAALAAYQKANGITPAAGYLGPLTRAQMKAKGLSGIWW